MAWAVTADPLRFDEAISWLGDRVVITGSEAARLDNDSRLRSFWIGGGLQLAQVQKVFDEIERAVEKGEPFADFKKRVRGTLDDARHTETVFRNAVQRAYNAGRYRQHKDVTKWRPFWMFDALLDSRTTAICVQRDAVILAADDAWWAGNHPPLHHRCRSGVRSLRKTDAERRGLTPIPPPLPPAPGWGNLPDDDPVWKPDPAKHAPGLVAELESKAVEPKKPRKPRRPKAHNPKHWEAEYSHLGEAAAAAAYGRAMHERALDRTVAETIAEFERLLGKHPSFDDPLPVRDLKLLPPGQTLRTTAIAAQLRGSIALAEHLRTVKRGGPFSLGGPADVGTREVYRFYELSLDKSVTRPAGWQIDRRPLGAPNEDGKPFDGRAFAHPISKKVVLSEWERRAVIAHEIAHAIEFSDPRAIARSRAFLAGRTKGEALQLLSKLAKKGNGYKPTEFARPDKFLDPYIGKEYGPTATEVTSMGYQWLFEDLSHFGEKDPEMLFFILGQLAGK